MTTPLPTVAVNSSDATDPSAAGHRLTLAVREAPFVTDHKGLGLSAEDRERIGGELAGGKAAVGVLAGADEAAAISAKLIELGGTAETHAVSDEALEAVAAAAPETPETPAAGA